MARTKISPETNQAAITRVLKAARAAGWPQEMIRGFKVTAAGVEVLFGEPGKADAPAPANPWDSVL